MPPTTSAADAASTQGGPLRRPAADWGRAAEGIQLAGVALFLLMNTTGVLPWSFWLEALALWPVLLMSAGLKLAFEKSRAPWMLLLGPVLVLGSLAWVASGARTELPVGPWASETKARPATVERVRLRTNLAAARLEVAAGGDLAPGQLVEARSVARPKNARVEVSAEGGTARVELQGGWDRGVVLPRRQRWRLELPAGLPVAFDLRGAGVRTRVDLARGRVEDGRIDGVFLGTELRLPAPERPAKLELNGVFNALQLVVPAGVPVRVHGAGFPFNAVQRELAGDGGAGYEVRVHGIFSAVTVSRAEPPEAEPPTPPAP